MKGFLKNWPGLVVVFVRAFHLFFSFGNSCRFEPTCSQYCAQVLREKGLVLGGWLSILRLLKCHPLGGAGYDSPKERVV